ncbi:hypothetical protein J7E62_27490 [Variovorax paradoxus]|nr:hypothetical protein [Variovorax paradoxus]
MTLDQYLAEKRMFRPDPRLIETAREWFEAGQKIGADQRAEMLAALRALHANMVAQDLDNEAERPTEDDYQLCMRNAAAVIAKVTEGTDPVDDAIEANDGRFTL